MQILCRVVQGLLLALVTATLCGILSHCFLHLCQVKLVGLITLTDLLPRHVGINLLLNLLNYVLIRCVLAFLGIVVQLDAHIFKIFHKFSFLTSFDNFRRHVVYLVNLRNLCFSFDIGLPICVLCCCRSLFYNFLVQLGLPDGFVVDGFIVRLGRIVLF